MTLKMYEIVDFPSFFEKVRNQKLSFKTSYRLTILAGEIEKHINFYQENFRNLLNTYGKKDENGNILEVYCEYDPNSKGGNTLDGRKIKGTIQWVDSKTALDATVNIYDNLFNVSEPEAEEDFLSVLNKDSLKVLNNCKLENFLKTAKLGDSYQFMRIGYFCLDKLSSKDKLIFNKTVGLKDSFNSKK